MRRIPSVAVALLLVLGGHARAQDPTMVIDASPADEVARDGDHDHDHGDADAHAASEDSDPPAAPRRRRRGPGPRRVPTPHGASLERANRLGLGTREAAAHLLYRAPEARWVAAARQGDVESLRWPVDVGAIGRGFGFVRRDRPEVRHNGIDVATPRGMVIRAVADGIVAYSDNGLDGYGNCVIIVHPNGWVTLYAHADRTTVQAGWRVRRGERIGFVGSTGRSDGPHLHFELHVDGAAVNPVPRFEGEPWVEGRARLAVLRRRGGGHTYEHLGELSPDFSADVRQPARRSQPRGRDATRNRPAAMVRATTENAAPTPTTSATPVDAVPPTSDLDRWLTAGTTRRERLELRAHPVTALQSPIRLEVEPALREGVLEFTVPLATNVRAAAPGRVVHVTPGPRGTRPTVVLLHANGMVSLYTALMDVTVSVGAIVAAGDRLGIVRDEQGVAFELRDRGRLVEDPRALFAPQARLISSRE